MRASLLLVLVALGLAGCVSGGGPSEPAPTTPTATPDGSDPIDAADEEAQDAAAADVPPPRVTTTFVNGTITSVGAGSGPPVSICCPTVHAAGENIEGRFTPEPGATGIVVELLWADPTFDLDLFLQAPDHQQSLPHLNGTSLEASSGHSWSAHDGQLGAPDRHASILVTQPEALALTGEWTWAITSKSSNATPFTVAVTVFHGAPPAPSFSAFAAG